MTEFYLSRMDLNVRRRSTCELIAKRQNLHAAILACFPPEHSTYGIGGTSKQGNPIIGVGSGPDGAYTVDNKGNSGPLNRILWRLDRTQTGERLWIVSPHKPSFEALQEQAGWQNEPSWETREYDPLLNRLEAGQHYGFRMSANPVKNVRVEEGKETKRVALIGVGQQADWLLSRAEQLGVEFVDDQVLVSNNEPLAFYKGRDNTRRKVYLGQAQYEGELIVRDAAKLRNKLTSGMGHGKAYGLGLMTLARA